MRFDYPYTGQQRGDGAWQVRFPDVPEALTEGATEADAHALARDALLAALGGLEKLRRDIPEPSKPRQHPAPNVNRIGSERVEHEHSPVETGRRMMATGRAVGV